MPSPAGVDDRTAQSAEERAVEIGHPFEREHMQRAQGVDWSTRPPSLAEWCVVERRQVGDNVPPRARRRPKPPAGSHHVDVWGSRRARATGALCAGPIVFGNNGVCGHTPHNEPALSNSHCCPPQCPPAFRGLFFNVLQCTRIRSTTFGTSTSLLRF